MSLISTLKSEVSSLKIGGSEGGGLPDENGSGDSRIVDTDVVELRKQLQRQKQETQAKESEVKYKKYFIHLQVINLSRLYLIRSLFLLQLDELCSQLQLSREAAESSQLAAAALQAQLSNVDSKSRQSEAELRVKSATLETDNTALRVS